MYKLFPILLLFSGALHAQTILFEEHFTNGVAEIDWEPGWADSMGVGDSMQVDFMAGNPSGDGTVGFVENMLSGGMVGTAVAGMEDMTDYMVQGWIYVTPDWGDAARAEYKGLVARFSNEPGYSYYQFVADFNTLAEDGPKLRLRKYDGGSVVIHDFFAGEIPGGVPLEASWHHMGLRLEGNQFWCYWDFEELPGCPYEDDALIPLSQGKFGIYVFNFVRDDAVYCDDIFVTDEYYDPQVASPMTEMKPAAFLIEPSFPNPFRCSTTIPVTLNRAGELRLDIYSLGGQLVANLHQAMMSAGQHGFTWDGNTNQGYWAAQGIYLVQGTALGQSFVRRLVLVR